MSFARSHPQRLAPGTTMCRAVTAMVAAIADSIAPDVCGG